MKNYKRYLVTSALPYANGPVHIGHLAGVYIPSDIYTRFLRLKKRDVISVCGSDEHGVPITLKAKKQGTTPQTVVNQYHAIIKQSFADFGIDFDIYSRTSSPTHHQTAADFFKTLYEKGEFLEKTTEQYFDPEANQFLADRYITGTCPKCGNDKAYGDQCEKCGSSLNATDLINPQSTISGATPLKKQTKHWFLPLDKHEPFLKKWILEDHKEWKPNVYGQCKSWIDSGLQPRAVSRDLDWGVKVPIANADGKVLYVWFDAPIGYISATKELTPDWEKYWKADDTRLIHFIGKDNIVFHCIVFPAMLRAEGSYILPDNVPANAFLNLEGDKISTSRNWAVWLHEYLNDFPNRQDSLRYVLTANSPENRDNDFTWKDFQARNNNELVAVFGNFVNRALVLTRKYFDNKVPNAELNPSDKEILDQLKNYKATIEQNLETFHFRDGLKELMNLARLGNKFLADTEPWKLIKTDQARVAAILLVSMEITAALAILAEPFLPFAAKKIQGFLNMQNPHWDSVGEQSLLHNQQMLNKPDLLFEKVEDHEIQQQIEKLHATKQTNQMPEKTMEPQKENIEFDDFLKLDMRVATILEAEKVAKTKKLLKFLVDTGIDQRTIVSGIAEFFNPNDLVGQQVVIVANLAPRKIRGIDSQGMILTAENAEGKLALLTPQEAMAAGALVK